MTEEVINGEWLRAKIGGRRGVRLALAAFLGIDPEKVSKITSGVRQVQGDEVLRIKEFFDKGLDVQDAPGFSEPPVGSPSPRIDVSAVLDEAPERPRNRADDPVGTTKVAIVGDTIQVAATIDADDVDMLIEQLELARKMVEVRRRKFIGHK